MTDPTGSTTPENEQAPAAAVPAAPPELDESRLDEHSQKVVDAIRNDYKQERAKRQAAEAKAKTPDEEHALSDYARLVEASKSDEQRREDALKSAQEAATTAAAQISQYQSRAVKAEIRAASADRFVDADVPFAYLDTAKYVTADGDIDQAAIQADLADLLTNKPGLAKPSGPRLPGPNPAQGGSSNGAPTPDDEMAAAVKAGDVKAQIRIQNQKLAALTAR